jgi:hypothetical protein
MRLLKFDNAGEFSLNLVSDDAMPRYAILSHTWGADAEEVSFNDMIDGTGTSKPGSQCYFLASSHSLIFL